MPNDLRGSLRSRILLLAILTCVFLGTAAFSFLSFLRHSQAASLAASERHLGSVATALAQAYTSRPASTESLRSLHIGPGKPAPPPPPAHPAAAAPPHPPPPPPPPADSLTPLTAATLQRENGIEGGFYSAAADALVGYAFPTHEGPGPTQQLPQREQPTIERLAQQAVTSGATQSFRFQGPHDAVLFVATPIREFDTGIADTKPIGAAWLMQRIPEFNGAQSRQLLLTTLGFGAAALVTALLAFFVITEVRGGVNGVLARLVALESGLRRPSASTGDVPLNEFRQVLQGIDKLALSLDQKIEKEKTLEAELRHKERLSSLGQFAAGVAHELRNPLATIRLRTQMSQRAPSPDAVVRNSTVILEEVDRLNTMIERLLSFSRPILLETEPVPLDELCCSLAARWSERAFPVSVTCHAGSALVLECDRSRLVQILDNLVENAVEAAAARSGPAGAVELATGQLDGHLLISVLDNGPGFGDAALKHALDPFFTTRESGTGLGLSIASELVQAHGGALRLENRPEGGALVSAAFPLSSPVLPRGDEQRLAHG